mmetsp:Transcript_26140/g.37439  ORF Transcript_26140/g.37439 Transcript_26140/m.37439 type:complete len:230 (-) Transcript_26140:871-1560(-)
MFSIWNRTSTSEAFSTKASSKTNLSPRRMTDLNLLILMDDCLKRITGSMKLHFTSLMLKIGSTSKDGSCFDAMLSIDTTSSFTDLTGAVGVGFELFAAGFEVSMALEGGANMERRLVDGDSDLTLCKGLVDRHRPLKDSLQCVGSLQEGENPYEVANLAVFNLASTQYFSKNSVSNDYTCLRSCPYSHFRMGFKGEGLSTLKKEFISECTNRICLGEFFELIHLHFVKN